MSLFIGSQVTIASCSLEHILKSTAESYHRHHLDLVSFSQFADVYVFMYNMFLDILSMHVIDTHVNVMI